jgi:hypothetical protein
MGRDQTEGVDLVPELHVRAVCGAPLVRQRLEVAKVVFEPLLKLAEESLWLCC